MGLIVAEVDRSSGVPPLGKDVGRRIASPVHTAKGLGAYILGKPSDVRLKILSLKIDSNIGAGRFMSCSAKEY